MKRIAVVALAGALLLTACGGSKSSDTATESSATGVAIESSAPVVETSVAAEAAAPEVPATEPPIPDSGLAVPGAAQDCATGKTVTADTLTIATGDPAFPPYVIDDKPELGQGFEAALGLAIARELGYDATNTKWIRTAFDAAIAPGPKDFDFNLQQFTITDERKKAIDFSNGYYTAPQAIFGFADSPAANARSMAELATLKIGVAAGSTSVEYVEGTIKPSTAPQIFNDNAAAKAALESKQVDAIVADLPTALFITATEIEGTKVFGQIAGSGTDEFGMLLAKGSPMTECVNKALATLAASGELDTITKQWMADYTSAPVIGG